MAIKNFAGDQWLAAREYANSQERTHAIHGCRATGFTVKPVPVWYSVRHIGSLALKANEIVYVSQTEDGRVFVVRDDDSFKVYRKGVCGKHLDRNTIRQLPLKRALELSRLVGV